VDYEEIEFDVEVGTAPQPPLLDGNGQPRPAQIMLQWNNDGVLSNTYTLSLGFAGQFLKRVLKRMLGRSRRLTSSFRHRSVRIRFADAYSVRLQKSRPRTSNAKTRKLIFATPVRGSESIRF